VQLKPCEAILCVLFSFRFFLVLFSLSSLLLVTFILTFCAVQQEERLLLFVTLIIVKAYQGDDFLFVVSFVLLFSICGYSCDVHFDFLCR
jgi:hypothetical protein